VIYGASLIGLRGESGKLKVRDAIRGIAKESSHLVLAFGQVDLELGYYYRNVIKGEKVSPTEFVDALISSMRLFFGEVDLGAIRCALKGVNLTAYNDRAFASRYIGGILSERYAQDAVEEVVKMTRAEFLGEVGQNEMHVLFNNRISSLANERGYAYFDINHYLASKDSRGVPISPPVVDPTFLSIRKDHHVVKSLAMYREHYLAVGNAFSILQG